MCRRHSGFSPGPGTTSFETACWTTPSRSYAALCVAVVQCEYCGNQRSVKATSSGALIEDQVMDLLNFEKSTKYNDRQKAALSYAEAIVWHLQTDDAFWIASIAISPSRSWLNSAA